MNECVSMCLPTAIAIFSSLPLHFSRVLIFACKLFNRILYEKAIEYDRQHKVDIHLPDVVFFLFFLSVAFYVEAD